MDRALRNPGFADRFTCPACLADFEGRRTTICPGCGAAVRCSIEHDPVCVCELAGETTTTEED